jgi:signal transduction histidine kinase
VTGPEQVQPTGSDARSALAVSPQTVVFVVDDDPLVTASLGTALHLETGYEIHTFGSGSAALTAAAATPPDVVISDFKMPGMDGLALLAALRAQVPEAVLILLTGYADKESAVRAINQIGIFQYVEKPWSTDDLLLKIRNAVERRNLIRDLRRANEALGEESAALRRSLAELERAHAELERAHAELGAAHVRLVQSERLAAVGRLAGGVAHEIANQLALLGYAEAIKARCGDDPQVAGFADELKAAQRRLTAMLDEVRDFATGGERYALEPGNVVEVVEEALGLLRYDAEVRACALVRRIAARPLARVNRGKLGQVVINLVRNAAQASPPGGEILVEVDETAAGARLAVTDHGAGMTPEVLAHLGEPFFTTRPHGLGLGWGIVRRIVEEHGGRLEVRSAPREGATVTVTLPPLPAPAGGAR